jgi:hypothetical protein
MPLADNPKKDAANVQFMKLQRAEDGKKAASEYEAAAVALRAKTERLKALRLARDAEEKTSPPAASAATKAKKPAKSKKKPSSTLSAWLDDQKKGGHNS